MSRLWAVPVEENKSSILLIILSSKDVTVTLSEDVLELLSVSFAELLLVCVSISICKTVISEGCDPACIGQPTHATNSPSSEQGTGRIFNARNKPCCWAMSRFQLYYDYVSTDSRPWPCDNGASSLFQIAITVRPSSCQLYKHSLRHWHRDVKRVGKLIIGSWFEQNRFQ